MTDTETNSDDGAAIEAAPFPLRPHQINVIGFTGHRTLAPWGSTGPGIEFWGCNALWESGIEWQKCTRWFDPHPREVIEGMPNHVAWLKDRDDMTVYLLDEWTDLCPGAERLPIERLRDGLGTTYFTNTISYMIGLAILELIPAANAWKESQRTEYPEGRRASSSAPPQPEIGIYGVDMATSCLAPGTRVLTEDLNWVEVEKVQEGDRLVSFDEYPDSGPGTRRQFRSGIVEKVEHQIKHCYRIEFEDGREIIASAEHPWLVAAENDVKWKRTDELVTGHHRSGRPSRVVDVVDTWEHPGLTGDWLTGYLAGAFDGEGHLSMNGGGDGGPSGVVVGFAQRDNAMADMVDFALSEYEFDAGVYESDGVRKYQLRGGRPEVLRFLGEVRPQRLLDQFDPGKLGEFRKRYTVAVTHIEDIGDHPVVGFQVDTKTFIAEGFATHNTEYGAQRPSCELFIGMALGLGIKVTIPPQSDLMKSAGMYGVSDNGELRAKMLHRKAEIEGLIGQMQQERGAVANRLGQLDGGIARHQGHISEIDYWLNVWTMPGTGGNREAASLPGQLDAVEAPPS
jgi:hypothetical protein